MRTATILGLMVGVLGFLIPERACGCPFRSAPRPLRLDAADAQIILYGWLKQAHEEQANGRFVVSAMLKSTPDLVGRQEIELDRPLNVSDPSNPPRYLVFGEVGKDPPDLYHGIPATPAFVDYFRGLLAVNPKDPGDILRYCSQYLEHPDREVAEDAYLEFAAAEQRDLLRVGKHLSPDRLRGWLANEKLRTDHKKMYALLLACCGSDSDADLIHGLIQGLVAKEEGAIQELLTGYVLLRPREGWEYLLTLAKDQSVSFTVRYATLRAARFFHDMRPDVVPKADRLSLMRHLIEQPDMADLPIEDLRRWGDWDMCGTVVSLWYRETHSEKIIQRSILRYAVACPDPRAKQLLDDVRKTDPVRVSDAEELVRLEANRTNAQEK